MSLGKTAVAFKSRIVHCPWELEGTSENTIQEELRKEREEAGGSQSGLLSHIFTFVVDDM